MPKLSDSMEDAVIVRWFKDSGDSFSRGEALAEIETDKATVVFEAESDGVIATIVVPEGSAARVGEAIATLDGEEASPPAPPKAEPAAANGQAAAAEPRAASPAAHAGAQPGRARATPVARRRAVELGLSLHGLEGTGPGGRITRNDVERTAAAGPAQREERGKGTVESVPLTATQATIARRMA